MGAPQEHCAPQEGQIAITMKLALIYPRTSVPADLDIILCICQALNEWGIEPHDVTAIGHEISKEPNFQTEELPK